MAKILAKSKLSVVQQGCQICLEDVDRDTIVTAFCGDACSAEVCSGCITQHVRVSIDSVPFGLLPKVRCPICLVAVNKSTWQAIATTDVATTKYTAACRRACSFLPPCCHDTTYTHLPEPTGVFEMSSSWQELQSQLGVSALERVRQQTLSFCSHALSARALVSLTEDVVSQYTAPLETQHTLVELMLPLIHDDERRATLLLAYHAKYKTVTTRCCGVSVCFNCKGTMTSHGASCDEDMHLEDAAILECRACRVTMVKVEGCSAVHCWCGFAMDWEEELQLRDTHRRGLLGVVDPANVELFAVWRQWQTAMIRLLRDEMAPLLLAMRLSRISWQLSSHRAICEPLRGMLRRYLRRRRSTLQLMQQQQKQQWGPEYKLAATRIRLMAAHFRATGEPTVPSDSHFTAIYGAQ